MTSLVAVLNKESVALAADSAVTVTGTNLNKIYNTVNKLFALSKHAPVGIMVYSSAEVMGIPIEALIKMYRASLGERKSGTLEDYYNDFLNFLKTDARLFPESVRIDSALALVNDRLRWFGDLIIDDVGAGNRIWEGPTKAAVRSLARTRIQELYDSVSSKPELVGVNDSKKRKLRLSMRTVTDFWKEQYRDKLGLTKSDVLILPELAVNLLTRDFKTGRETGFVIAGFGEDEHYPTVRSFELELSVLGIHKCPETPAVSGPAIVPFAQTDMIDLFVQGRETEIDIQLLALIDDYFSQEKDRFIALNPPGVNASAITATLDRINNELKDHVADKLNAFTRDYHIDPLLDVIELMPKKEMATMAEALINLTAIKRRMSHDEETVGPPIDVAVISKGDGFIWIERKHYFKPELNSSFFHNYFNGGRN